MRVELDHEEVERIARRVIELVREQNLFPAADDQWINSDRAAKYLGISKNALHKLTASREIPFHQDRPNAKCWFKRSELDGWRAS